MHTSSPSPVQLRAALLARIRQFFHKRNVLEVETPLLCFSTIPSAHLESFVTYYSPTPMTTASPTTPTALYLQTSPEFAMKRLLAQYHCDIYQICKAFRNYEYGKIHHPEFTMLEWYRVGYDHYQLMDEVDELLRFILNIDDTNKSQRFTYAAIFEHYLQINPHSASIEELQQCAQQRDVNIANTDWPEPTASSSSGSKNIREDSERQLQRELKSKCEEYKRDMWLQLLLTHLIEPQLTQQIAPVFIYDFPSSQAALAKVRCDENTKLTTNTGMAIAERFEVYVRGIELANGFHELRDPDEQRQRFETDLATRRRLGMSSPPLDEKFLSALSAMPPCAGVALGVDRLLMILANANTLRDVMSFDIETILP